MATTTIKRLHNPICKTCVHFRPNLADVQYTSAFSKCAKFGNKVLVSGKIHYDYADMCRNNEKLCGQDGREYKEDPWFFLKYSKYYSILFSPIILSCIALVKT